MAIPQNDERRRRDVAFGHHIRRQLLSRLQDEEKPVQEQADHLRVLRPMVSKHLRGLVEAGLSKRKPPEGSQDVECHRARPPLQHWHWRADKAHHDGVQQHRAPLEGASDEP